MLILSARKRTVVAVAIAVALMAAFVAVVSASAAERASVPPGPIVVIDPGHGGRDGGVVSADGIKESDVNLAISRGLRAYLTDAGYTVVMTRDSDVDLAEGTSDGYKRVDMLARRRIIEDARPDLVISIHQNSYGSPGVRGAQVFYAPGSEEGKAYADRVQSVLSASLGTDRVAKEGDYYILQCTSYPSLLVECGFLTDPTEAALLATDEYRMRVAYVLSVAVRELMDAPV